MESHFQYTGDIPYAKFARGAAETQDSIAALGRLAHLRTVGGACGDASACGHRLEVTTNEESCAIAGTCTRIDRQYPDGPGGCRERVYATIAFMTAQLTEPDHPDFTVYR